MRQARKGTPSGPGALFLVILIAVAKWSREGSSVGTAAASPWGVCARKASSHCLRRAGSVSLRVKTRA